MNNTIKIDEADAEDAIKKGREEAPKRKAAERWRDDHLPGGFYSKEPSTTDKLLILSKHYGEIWSNWYQLWIEIRAGIWTRLGLR